jgi:hypothetical protein
MIRKTDKVVGDGDTAIVLNSGIGLLHGGPRFHWRCQAFGVFVRFTAERFQRLAGR